ncbi:MAG: TonB-dependent receptor plug domain-containing protein, partial [Tannerellaceae bacterium]|nr:TonB-dependent receptor plug domain-containing protein [Tannerellaceae bacterium]
MKRKKLMLLFFLCVCTAMRAQTDLPEIKGIITSNKEILMGAPVRITDESTGTSDGTVTDENGEYVLKNLKPNNPYTIWVTYVGCTEFVKKNILVGSEESYLLNVDLKSSAELGEVVVTAMGIKKEARRLGYSVQEVKGADVNKVRDSNPVNALAGKIAGLSIGASTELMGRPEIVLRGSKDLLFVVDGVPINSDTWNLSPDDIESYSILKGPNAAALYGSRGINGAVVITTKKGLRPGGESAGKDWIIEINSATQLDGSFVTLPESQYEYGRGTGFRYSYGDVLYDNTQRLPEWGPRFEGQP